MTSDAVNRKKGKKARSRFLELFYILSIKTVFTIFLLGTALIIKNYLKRKKVLVEGRRAPFKWWLKEILIVVSD